MIGGFNRYYLSTVSSHDLKTNTWSLNSHRLNKARCNAASCLLADHVYLFAGFDNRFLNSIEKIDAASIVSSNKITAWRIIKVPRNILSPRIDPAVTRLNENEIAILGGFANQDCLCDVVIFDVRTGKCKKVVNGGVKTFTAVNN